MLVLLVPRCSRRTILGEIILNLVPEAVFTHWCLTCRWKTPETEENTFASTFAASSLIVEYVCSATAATRGQFAARQLTRQGRITCCAASRAPELSLRGPDRTLGSTEQGGRPPFDALAVPVTCPILPKRRGEPCQLSCSQRLLCTRAAAASWGCGGARTFTARQWACRPRKCALARGGVEKCVLRVRPGLALIPSCQHPHISGPGLRPDRDAEGCDGLAHARPVQGGQGSSAKTDDAVDSHA